METLTIDLDQEHVLKERRVVENVLEFFNGEVKLHVRTICHPLVHLIGINFGSSKNSGFAESIFSVFLGIFREHRNAQVNTCSN